MKFIEIFKTVFVGIDNLGSIKRMLLAWIGIAIWTFVHVIVFIFIVPFNEKMADQLIWADLTLIISLAGLNVVERKINAGTSGISQDDNAADNEINKTP